MKSTQLPLSNEKQRVDLPTTTALYPTGTTVNNTGKPLVYHPQVGKMSVGEFPIPDTTYLRYQAITLEQAQATYSDPDAAPFNPGWVYGLTGSQNAGMIVMQAVGARILAEHDAWLITQTPQQGGGIAETHEAIIYDVATDTFTDRDAELNHYARLDRQNLFTDTQYIAAGTGVTAIRTDSIQVTDTNRGTVRINVDNIGFEDNLGRQKGSITSYYDLDKSGHLILDGDGNLSNILSLDASHVQVTNPPTYRNDIVNFGYLTNALNATAGVKIINLGGLDELQSMIQAGEIVEGYFYRITNVGVYLNSTTTANYTVMVQALSTTQFAPYGVADGSGVHMRNAVVRYTSDANGGTFTLVNIEGTQVVIEQDLSSNSTTSVPSVSAVKTAVDTHDANVVHKTGVESIAGEKTFSGGLVLSGSNPGGKPSIWATGDIVMNPGCALFFGYDDYGKYYLSSRNGASGISLTVLGNATTFADNGAVGFGVSAPVEKVEVAGNIKATGSVKATTFWGDGSQLTNLPGSTIIALNDGGPKFTAVQGNYYTLGNVLYKRIGPTGISSTSAIYQDTTNWAILVGTAFGRGFTQSPVSPYTQDNNSEWKKYTPGTVLTAFQSQIWYSGGKAYRYIGATGFGGTSIQNTNFANTTIWEVVSTGSSPVATASSVGTVQPGVGLNISAGLLSVGSVNWRLQYGDASGPYSPINTSNYTPAHGDYYLLNNSAVLNPVNMVLGDVMAIQTNPANPSTIVVRATSGKLIGNESVVLLEQGSMLVLQYAGGGNFFVIQRTNTQPLLGNIPVASNVKTAVSAGAYAQGEFQGTQPTGSVRGMRFVDASYMYNYMLGMNDTDGTGFVWVRTQKAA